MGNTVNVARELLKVARLLTGFVRTYVQHKDGTVFYMSTRKWPKIAVEPQGADRYRVYTFESKKAVEKKLIAMFKHFVDRDPDMVRAFVDKATFYRAKTLEELNGWIEKFGGPDKFAKEMAKRELMPTIAGSVDAMCHYQGGLGIVDRPMEKLNNEFTIGHFIVDKKNSGPVSKQKLADFLIVKMKMPLSMFENHFGEIESSEVESIDSAKHGKWILYTEERVHIPPDAFFGFLDRAESLLQRRGMAHLCYGKAMIVTTIKGRVVAQYMENGDFIRIRAKNFKGNATDVREFIHELAHREWFKFLSADARKAAVIKYHMAHNHWPSVRELGVVEGDVLIDHANDERFEVLDTHIDNVVVRLLDTPNERRKKSLGKMYRIPASNLASNDIEFEGKPKPQTDFAAFFPTSYSNKNPEEMYAEQFAEWVFGRLRSPALEWFESLH